MILSPLPYLGFRITQQFGEHPEVYKQFGHLGHNGIDLSPLVPGTKGVIVYAPHEGYVHLGDEGTKGYGQYVTILGEPAKKDGTRHRSDLGHLASFLVQDGQYVAMNDPIGIMGSTGFATGIHVHWTYKQVDRNGITMSQHNGYGGALPIGNFARHWIKKTLV
jgi:murein DD-endopeptidase MepM/ murein hydrolase activator NlpD